MTNHVQSFPNDPLSEVGIAGTSSIGLQAAMDQETPIRNFSMAEFSG
jgi:hypothetical protein